MLQFKRSIKDEFCFSLASIALIWQFLFLYVPLIILLINGFWGHSNPSQPSGFSFAHYSWIFSFLFLKILFNSFFLAFQTTLICLIMAYPLAYFLVFKMSKVRETALLMLILPSWTNIVIQIYSWFFLLKQDGFFSLFFCKIGILSHPMHMLNNGLATLIVMVYCYLPFMTLPIYSSLFKIKKSFLEASADLGANRYLTLKKIVFPLSIHGVLTGIFLVFIPAFGEFAIPEFMGGAKKMFWGNLITSKFMDYCDWRSGAAVTCGGIIFVLLFFLLFYSFYKFLRFVKGLLYF
jgi:spermidine/putrescine transport system permease protein